MRKKKRRRKSAKVIWFERISQSWIKICSMIKLYPQEKLIRQRNDAKRRTDQFRELQTRATEEKSRWNYLSKKDEVDHRQGPESGLRQSRRT